MDSFQFNANMDVAAFIIVFLLFSHVLAFLIIRKYRKNYHKLRDGDSPQNKENLEEPPSAEKSD